jgi:hypothetical protein
VLFHKEGTVVDDASLEETLNHELFPLKHSVHLDNAALQEIKLVCFCFYLLEDVSFYLGLSFKHINNIVQNGIVVLNMTEVWDLFDRAFNEFKHMIVVLIDAKLDFIFYFRLHLNDLLVVLI